MDGTAKLPPAGWYADPDDEALQRFWDGKRWTSSRMPRIPGVPIEGAAAEQAEQPRYASDARPPEGAAGPAVATPGAGLPPAAWYADPENAQGMRYWDGARWTEHRTNYLAEAPAARPSEGMVAAGYLLAFFLPIVGVVIGVILTSRKSPHGPWVLGLSLLFVIAFIAIGAADNGG